MMPRHLLSIGIAFASFVSLTACGSTTPDATSGVSTVDATASTTSAPPPSATQSAAPTTSAATTPSAAPSGQATTPPAEGIWMKETLGGIALGMAEADVEKVLGKPDKTTAPTEEGASGDWAFGWTYKAKGIDVSFAGPKKDGVHHVRLILTTKTSKLKTGAGIGAGSTKADIEKAYGKDVNKESTADQILVGPEQYDAMKFHMEKGAVVGVVIGADGE